MSDAGVVVYGATGLTGGLVVDALRARGVQPVIAGRNERKLLTLAQRAGLDAERIAVVEPDDATSLARALERGRVVIACAGPFAQIGEPVVAACATHGVHYVDSAGEASFVRMVARRYDETARANHAALVPALAFEVAIGDAAAARAAQGMEGEVDVDIAYAVSNFATSNGTRASILATAAMPSFAIERGVLHEEPIASQVQTIAFRAPFAESPAFSFASPELVTVPRHVRVRSMRIFLAAKRAKWMPTLTRAMPLMSRMAVPIVSRFLEQQGAGGPSLAKLAAARFQIVAEVRAVGGRARRRVTVTGSDVYRVSAALLTEGALALRDASPAPEGMCAPSQVLAAERVFDVVRGFEAGALHVEEWS